MEKIIFSQYRIQNLAQAAIRGQEKNGAGINEQHKPPLIPWRAMRSGRSELGADAVAIGAMAITAKMLVPACSGLGEDEEEWSTQLQTRGENNCVRMRRNEAEQWEEGERGYLAAADEGALAVSDPPGESDGRREEPGRGRELGRCRSGGWRRASECASDERLRLSAVLLPGVHLELATAQLRAQVINNQAVGRPSGPSAILN